MKKKYCDVYTIEVKCADASSIKTEGMVNFSLPIIRRVKKERKEKKRRVVEKRTEVENRRGKRDEKKRGEDTREGLDRRGQTGTGQDWRKVEYRIEEEKKRGKNKRREETREQGKISRKFQIVSLFIRNHKKI